MSIKKILLTLSCALTLQISLAGNGHNPDPDSTEQRFFNWFNLDPKENKIYGVSTERAYKEILKGKKSKPVIVAIIDSGVDVDHEDIKDKIWINEDEIAGNGIDDDKNGYVDDIHGWNFLGNSKGENIEHENMELTRLYKKYDSLFKDKAVEAIKPEDKKFYEEYLKIKEEYQNEYLKATEENLAFKTFERNFKMIDEIIKAHLKKDEYTLDELKAIQSDNKGIEQAKTYLVSIYEKGFTPQDLEKYREHYENTLSYHLNVDFDARTIIGDNPENTLDSLYGNNDVEGTHAEHGTHVAGIIGANRENNLGIKGIAGNVRLMVLRAVPDGDERDKDIANAIKYAVNNGAQIINMSFGKSYSPQKEAVDAAMKKAEEKGVLLIHAAGNDAQNIDLKENYPNNKYLSTGKPAKNWLTIGASSIEANDDFVGSFSNYGKEGVDVFAPGVKVYSLKPGDKYESNSGTSMACPVVSGVAALLMSYYPQLSPQQVKDIILKSSVKYKQLKVNAPTEEEDKKEKVNFDKLSASGGLVNAYEAVKLAEEVIKSNKKINKF